MYSRSIQNPYSSAKCIGCAQFDRSSRSASRFASLGYDEAPLAGGRRILPLSPVRTRTKPSAFTMSHSSVPRGLIVTADDFGLHEAVNDAVERAHRDGVLTAASLMVGAPAAADAIDRARRLPSLRVGLHVVLADGPAVL